MVVGGASVVGSAGSVVVSGGDVVVGASVVAGAAVVGGGAAVVVGRGRAVVVGAGLGTGTVVATGTGAGAAPPRTAPLFGSTISDDWSTASKAPAGICFSSSSTRDSHPASADPVKYQFEPLSATISPWVLNACRIVWVYGCRPAV